MKAYFAGKRILITGAASGIGSDLVVLLKGWGAVLALADILPIPKELTKGSSNILTYKADVTDPAPWISIRDELLTKWGQVDIVIAAAGVGGVNPANCFSQPMDHKTMSVNYFGTVNTLFPFIEPMKKKGEGQLVGICSLAAYRGLPQASSYSASKAAQMTLLESWRLDLQNTGIKVSCIHPGFVITPMTDHAEFEMPFMISVRESSLYILKAIAGRKKQYCYPWRPALLSELNRFLPNCIYDFLMPRISPSRSTAPKMFSVKAP